MCVCVNEGRGRRETGEIQSERDSRWLLHVSSVLWEVDFDVMQVCGMVEVQSESSLFIDCPRGTGDRGPLERSNGV